MTSGSQRCALGGDEVDDVLRDLVADLERFEVDTEACGEEPDLFGEDGFPPLVRRALTRLDELGVR